MEIQVIEIRNRLTGTARRDFAAPYESSKTLSDLDVKEVRRVKFVVVAKEAKLHSCAKGGLQEKL